MNNPTRIFSQSSRFVRPIRPLYIVDVIRALHLRYAFVRVPVTRDEIAPSDERAAVVLSQGRMEHDGRTIAIETLQLYRQAISVTVNAGTTDDADLVMTDLLREGADVIALTPNQPRMYISQLEFTSDAYFDDIAPPATRIALRLSEMIGRYADTVAPAMPPAFRVNAMALQIDPLQYVLPCDFRIERRVGRPFHENVYFTQAPLRTADHVEALEELERSLART